MLPLMLAVDDRAKDSSGNSGERGGPLYRMGLEFQEVCALFQDVS